MNINFEQINGCSIIPQAPEVERILLSAFFADKDAYEKTRQMLIPEMFYVPANMMVYKSIHSLAISNMPIDVITVTEQLTKDGNLDRLDGGADYVANLSQIETKSANVEYYAKIIADKYVARQVIDAGNKMILEAKDKTIDIDTLLKNAQSSIFKIVRDNKRTSCRQIDVIAEQVAKNIQTNSEGKALSISTGFKEIDEILMQNELRRKDYKNIKDELSNNQHKKENFMKTYWKKGWKLLGYDNPDEINKFIKHLSLKKLSFIKSNTITILIDGFRTQLREPFKQWEKLIDALKSDTIFYFYRWPSGNFGYNMINHFSNTKERAKFSGKLLAHILESNQFLKGYQINLIGFSLGNQVIKYCLYELNRIKSKFIFKNVILIAAAIQLKEEATIKEIIENMIADKFINCYSKKDYVLNKFYIPATGQNDPVGLNELIIKNNENINLVNNHEFQSGHLDYNYEEVVKKIFEKYNDI